MFILTGLVHPKMKVLHKSVFQLYLQKLVKCLQKTIIKKEDKNTNVLLQDK